MVPIKEMTDVLKVVKETANLKPKTWVRLKRGVFKDDLAQVCVALLFATVFHLFATGLLAELNLHGKY